jgi:hypothetical protein
VTVIPSNSPSARIVARGHKLKFSRDNFGELRIQAQSIKR